MLVRLSIWALVVFHLLLLARRIGDATIADPVIALRWLAASAIASAGGLHIRRGGSLVAGRGALAFWLAVFLLHAFALAPGAAPVIEAPVPVWSLALMTTAVLLLLNGPATVRQQRLEAAAETVIAVPTVDRIAQVWARPPPISQSA